MRFNEKLQYLRKEKKMSQEQLADMLDVTRQSVSKWESGTTYPEMDKLIMLCKIFKCSLDDFTNDEISDINTDKKNVGSLSINNIVDGFLGFVEKTVKMFQSMSFKESVGCVFSTIILALLLMLVSVPFAIVKDGFNSFISEIAINGYTTFIMGVFGFILDAIAVVLYIILLVYIFKIAYLDKYEFVSEKNSEETSIEKTIQEEKKTTKEIKVKSVDEPKENALFKALGGIALGFIKFLTVCFSIPVLFILVALCISFALDVYLIINGITFIGITLLIILGIIACVWLIEIVSIFLFNRKASFRRLLWTFIFGLVGVGLSIGVCLLELSNIDYKYELPENLPYEKKMDSKEYTMSDKLILKTNLMNSVEYIEDESFGNKVIVELEYYDNFMTIRFSDESEAISIDYLHYGTEFKDVKLLTENFKKNLKDKVIYDYDELHDVDIRVKASKENIEKIKKNTESVRAQERYNSCSQRIEDYIDQIDEYETKVSSLEEENAELEMKVEELEEYKNRVNEVISQ